MRTARLLPVCPSMQCSGGCTCPGSVPARGCRERGGVPAQGVYLLRGTCQGGVPAQGGTCPGTPPLRTEWEIGAKILPCPKPRLRAVIRSQIFVNYMCFAAVVKPKLTFGLILSCASINICHGNVLLSLRHCIMRYVSSCGQFKSWANCAAYSRGLQNGSMYPNLLKSEPLIMIACWK